MLATNMISEEKTSKNNKGIIEKKNEGSKGRFLHNAWRLFINTIVYQLEYTPKIRRGTM